MTSTLQTAIQGIDQANSTDPKNGTEVLYSQRMLETLQAFEPQASEPLTLACYAQHVCRWKLVRKDYPAGLNGYLKWRTELAKLHAEILAEIMQESGYGEESIGRASNIIQKKKLKTDPEAQTLEDVSCLVFLNHYFDAFAGKHSEKRIIDIVQKTWGKMSGKGHQAALALTLPPHLQKLVVKALA
jgi:hypothetical protein